MTKLLTQGRLWAIAALIVALNGAFPRQAGSETAKHWRWIGVWGFADCTYICDSDHEDCMCLR